MMTAEGHAIRDEILGQINEERFLQDTRWGGQNLNIKNPGWYAYHELAEEAKMICDATFQEGTISWHEILLEEVAEVFAEDDPEKQAEGLIQVAAVCVSMIECLKRNGKI